MRLESYTYCCRFVSYLKRLISIFYTVYDVEKVVFRLWPEFSIRNGWRVSLRRQVPNGDWISSDRKGLTFNDCTSAAFAMDIPWDKVRNVTCKAKRNL